MALKTKKLPSKQNWWKSHVININLPRVFNVEIEYAIQIHVEYT